MPRSPEPAAALVVRAQGPVGVAAGVVAGGVAAVRLRFRWGALELLLEMLLLAGDIAMTEPS